MNTVTPPVTVGLYRHFKGNYYYVTDISHNAYNYDSLLVNYFDVCHPEKGKCTRPLNDFTATVEEDGRVIKDRPDNITGQIARFERIHELNWQIKSVSTEQLINELQTRVDSPIHELDIEGLMSLIAVRDYAVGELYEATEQTPRGVFTLATFETLDEAKTYLATHKTKKNTKIFKRTFMIV